MSFESKIEYIFKDKKHLKNILIHPSHSVSEFELYEFLGDRILGSIIATLVFEKEKSLKNISNHYNNIVNTNSLSQIAQNWEIEKYFQHSIQFLSTKVYADIVEATIAAIYLDSNYETIFIFVKNLYEKFLKMNIFDENYKLLLQEYSQKMGYGLPIYQVIEVIGQEHRKIYKIEVSILQQKSCATGYSKQEASKKAAELLFNRLKNE